jgi:hypothetical protein
MKQRVGDDHARSSFTRKSGSKGQVLQIMTLQILLKESTSVICSDAVLLAEFAGFLLERFDLLLSAKCA